MAQEQEYVTMAQAARIFGVNRMKISRLLKKDIIRAYTNPYDSRSRLVKLSELEKYFQHSYPVETGK